MVAETMHIIKLRYRVLNAERSSQKFTALLEFVRDHPGEQVPER